MRAIAIWLMMLCVAPAHAMSPMIARDNDHSPVPRPKEDPDAESIWWDGADHMLIYQIGKLVDLNWYRWRLGKTFRIRAWSGAGNVDALDETPDSAWFTNRMGRESLSPDEILRGANRGDGPDLTQPLTVISGKSSGLTPGFVVEDARGDRYVLKLDPFSYPELQSGAEMIASRVLHAAGYFTPEYHLISFRREQLKLDEKATIRGKYNKKRPMREADLGELLEGAAQTRDGRYRATASLFLQGKLAGPDSYRGLRRDDPNDTVFHEDRRELRGLRVIMSWLNNTDARRGNTLAAWDGHVRHYQLDFSASLGSGNIEPKPEHYGHEYLVDPPVIVQSFLAAGLWVKPWEREARIFYPALGTFQSEPFHPGRWKTSYANPAFERLTNADAFWAARIVTAFSDEDVRAAVRAARYSDAQAERAAAETLIRRRDRIGEYWFDARRVNPLDDFEAEWQGGKVRLRFFDLAVERKYADPQTTRYRAQANGAVLETSQPEFVFDWPEGRNELKLILRTSRDGGRRYGRKLRLKLERLTATGSREALRISELRR